MEKKTSRPFKILGINHIALVTKPDFDSDHLFTNLLGLTCKGSEVIEEQQTSVRFFELNSKEVGNLELLRPQQGEGPIAHFIKKKGCGIHHIALTVDHIDKAIAYLLGHHIKMIDQSPRKGAHGSKIAFVHPDSAGGLLIELVEDSG